MRHIFSFMFIGFSLLGATTPYKKHYLSLISQNDAYVDSMIDRYYTTGQSLLYSSSEGDWGGLNHFGFIKGETSFSLSLTQKIYTPKAKFDVLPPIDDHPYAGILSVVFGIHHRTKNALESLGVEVGLSGKYAFGKETQNGIHELKGVGLTNGWATQIGGEMIVNLHYEWIYKHSLYESAYFDIEILPSLSFAFGNASIYGKVNALLKMGYNLSSTFLPQGVIGENGGLGGGRVYADGIGVFAFMGAGGAYVMRKMAIDGNLFGRDHYARDVNLCHWVGNVNAGVSLVSGAFSATYMIVYTTKEFQEQKGNHAIGSILLAYSF